MVMLGIVLLQFWTSCFDHETFTILSYNQIPDVSTNVLEDILSNIQNSADNLCGAVYQGLKHTLEKSDFYGAVFTINK